VIRELAPDARSAHRELEARLRPFVARRVSGASDVDDVVQDVFLRMHKSVGALRDEERFGPWVYRVARSAIAEHRRARARHPVAEGAAPEEAIAPPDEPEDGAVAREVATYVAPFITLLPSPYREALTLTELEGLTQKEAARMLGVSVPAMKSRVQRGRERLRELFEACCEFAVDARGRVIECTPRSANPVPCACHAASSRTRR
jgi:RNA polymerase sigma-70 factor (ECF subfamily)